MQTGRIQIYVYGLLGGVAFFAILQYFLASKRRSVKRHRSSRIARSIALLAMALLALLGVGLGGTAFAAPEPEHASQPPPAKARTPGQIAALGARRVRPGRARAGG